MFAVRRLRYETDLSDLEWLLLEPLIPAAKSGGRRRDTDMREVMNGIFYVLRTGGAWSLLPHDFPPHQTVYGYFNAWRKSGVQQSMNDALRTAVREQEEREEEISAGIIDSQSVKTTSASKEDRGFDAGKAISGRKRFILVDVLGLILHVFVTKASLPERKGAQELLKGTSAEILKQLQLIWADGGYGGPDFTAWVLENYAIFVEIIKRTDDAKGFVILPRRWVVERTFSWFGKFRRLSKDYEVFAKTTAALIYMAMLRIMLQRLAHDSAAFC